MIGFEKARNLRRHRLLVNWQPYQFSIEQLQYSISLQSFKYVASTAWGNSHRQLGPTSRTLYCLWTSLWKLMVSLISMPFPNTSQQHGMQRMESWVMGKGGCFISDTNWIVKKIMVGLRRHEFGIFWGTTCDMRREKAQETLFFSEHCRPV